jgi:hypothetical protein
MVLERRNPDPFPTRYCHLPFSNSQRLKPTVSKPSRYCVLASQQPRRRCIEAAPSFLLHYRWYSALVNVTRRENGAISVMTYDAFAAANSTRQIPTLDFQSAVRATVQRNGRRTNDSL